MANSMTINGVTIEFPNDVNVSIVDGFVSIRQSSKPAVTEQKMVSSQHAVEVFNNNEELNSAPIVGRKLLPANADRLIIRHLRENDGKRYTIGISKFLSRHLKLKSFTKPYAYALNTLLDEMVSVGVLIVLRDLGSHGGSRLYGLAAMQEPTRETHERNGTAVADRYAD